MIEIALYLLGGIIGLIFLEFLFPIIWIDGNSMYPALKDRQFCISTRFFKYPVPDKVYVYESPQGEIVVKRFMFERKSGCYFVGDNRDHSFDSRHYGGVDRSCIIARVLFVKKEVKN